MDERRGRVVADGAGMADDHIGAQQGDWRGDDDATVSRSTAPVTVTRTEPGPSAPARSERRRANMDDAIDVELPRSMNLRQDRVRWGPILAGLVTALTTLLLLSLLGVAIGLTTVNAGDAAAAGGPPGEAGRNSAAWGAVSALFSFLLGGYVAGKTAAVFDRNWGALNGALVFLVAVPVTLWLASQGLGSILGNLGSFAGSLNADPGQAQQAAQNIQPIDVARAAERARNAAWGALGGSILGLVASTLGGALGTRRELEIERRTGQVSE